MALDDGKWPMVLKELESEWPFLLKLDQLPEKGQMHELLAFTRMQPFRELFIQAEPQSCKCFVLLNFQFFL